MPEPWRIEISWGDLGLAPPPEPSSWAWTDVSEYVSAADPFVIMSRQAAFTPTGHRFFEPDDLLLRLLHWATTARLRRERLSSMRSSYRSRMKARRRRG